jgi:putative transposase
MVRNHNLAKSISDVGRGTFTNFLAYKLERKGGKLVEIDRWFPSSKLCSNCFYQVSDMPLVPQGGSQKSKLMYSRLFGD